MKKERAAGARIFEKYFHAHFEGLHRYAYTLLGDNDEAKDAVQAVFIKIWEKKEQLDEERSVKSYLYTSIYNYCLNVKRHLKIKSAYASELNHKNYYIHDEVIRKEAGKQIMNSLEKLPPQCRQIFYKSRFEEKKYSEIANEMNLSVKTIEVQIGKALRILREKLFTIRIWLIILFISKIIK